MLAVGPPIVTQPHPAATIAVEIAQKARHSIRDLDAMRLGSADDEDEGEVQPLILGLRLFRAPRSASSRCRPFVHDHHRHQGSGGRVHPGGIEVPQRGARLTDKVISARVSRLDLIVGAS